MTVYQVHVNSVHVQTRSISTVVDVSLDILEIGASQVGYKPVTFISNIQFVSTLQHAANDLAFINNYYQFNKVHRSQLNRIGIKIMKKVIN